MKPRTGGLYYLAGPYTHGNRAIVAHRRIDHMHAERWLLHQEIDTIAPINSSGALEQLWQDLPIEYEFWKTRDRKSIKYTDGVILIKLPGWENSTGVTDELQYAKRLKKPIYSIVPVIDEDTGYIDTFEWE